MEIPAVAVNGLTEPGGSEGTESTDSTEEAGITEATQIGETTAQTVSVELPVTWREDGQAVAHFTFELNDFVIGIHQPEETWHSGKHTILLYYPIENVVANYTNTFNVYLRMAGGMGKVDAGSCIASISGQSMGAAAAWDGTIEVDEMLEGRFVFGLAKIAQRGFSYETAWEIDETVKRQMEDAFPGRTAIGAFAMPVDMV